jgi:hypothetical protein
LCQGRCLLNISGVILFVRLGWVVGNAGIFQTTLIVLISLALTSKQQVLTQMCCESLKRMW